MKKINIFLKGHPYISSVSGLVVVLIVIALVRGGGGGQPVTEAVVRGAVVEEVSVTGRIVSAENLDLAFEKTVKVSRVPVSVGDKVTVGQTLVISDNGDSAASVAEARARLQSAAALLKQQQANLLTEQVRLEELKRGARPEELLVAEAKLESAESDFANELKQAFTSADNAIHNNIDQFIQNPKGKTPRLLFDVSNGTIQNKIENERIELEKVLLLWEKEVVGTIDQDDFSRLLTLSRTNLSRIVIFLNDVAQAVNALKPGTSSSDPTQTEVDLYKQGTASARTEVNSALSTLSAAAAAEDVARREFNLTAAGSSIESLAGQEAEVLRAEADVDSQRAQVAVAAASVQNAEAQFGKTVITSPIDAIVATLPAKAGEIIPANEKAISLISNAVYQIETNIPESDVSKVHVGNEAKVTLDAYGPETIFVARVVSVDPGETLEDGVASYKTKLEFAVSDERIRSGMTANVRITGESRESVIKIPSRAVSVKDGQRMVTIVEDKVLREIIVEVGLRGSDGFVEILSGLSEGQVVVTDTAE